MNQDAKSAWHTPPLQSQLSLWCYQSPASTGSSSGGKSQVPATHLEEEAKDQVVSIAKSWKTKSTFSGANPDWGEPGMYLPHTAALPSGIHHSTVTSVTGKANFAHMARACSPGCKPRSNGYSPATNSYLHSTAHRTCMTRSVVGLISRSAAFSR